MDSTALDKFRADVAVGPQADRQVSTAWVLLPTAVAVYGIAVAAYLIGVAVPVTLGCISRASYSSSSSQYSNCVSPSLTFVLGITPYLQIVSFILGIGYAYLVFLLVRRRNTHFARLKRLKTDLIAALREIERSRGTDVEADLVQAETVIRVAEPNEGEKSSILLALLVLLLGIPYVSIIGIIVLLYTFYSLQRDWQKHDELEDVFFRWVLHACYMLGVPFSMVRTRSISKRSGGWYVVVTIFTVGIFLIYWVYSLVNDPRAHLNDHAQLETGILTALGGAVPPAATAAGSSGPPPPAVA